MRWTPRTSRRTSMKNPRGRRLRTCKACVTVFPPTHRWCPACGEEYPVGVEVKEEDVALVDVTGWQPPDKPKKDSKPRRTRQQINDDAQAGCIGTWALDRSANGAWEVTPRLREGIAATRLNGRTAWPT